SFRAGQALPTTSCGCAARTTRTSSGPPEGPGPNLWVMHGAGAWEQGLAGAIPTFVWACPGDDAGCHWSSSTSARTAVGWHSTPSIVTGVWDQESAVLSGFHANGREILAAETPNRCRVLKLLSSIG